MPMCLCCFAEDGTAQRIFPFIMVVFSFIILCVVIKKRFKLTFTSVLVLLFCAAIPLGVYRVQCADEKYNSAQQYIGKSITAEGTVYRYQNNEYGYTVYLAVHLVDGKETEDFNVRIRVDGTAAPLLYDTAVFDITPESFPKAYYRPESVAEYYRSEGLQLDATGVYKGTKSRAGGVLNVIRIMESCMSEALNKLRNSSLAKALIIGDKSYLDGYTSAVFSKAGISHVLALSGLHIGIILLFIRKLLAGMTFPRFITMLVSTLTVLFYIAMTGGSYSVMRAGIMTIAGFCSALFFLRCDILNSVSISMALIMLFEPYAVKSLSFQLSCGAVVGIGVFAIPLIRRVVRAVNGISRAKVRTRYIFSAVVSIFSSVAVTLAVFLFTFPSTLYYMGNVLLVSFLSNIVIVPLTAPVMIMLIISVMLYCIPFFPVRWLAVRIFIPVSDIMLDIFKGIAEFFSRLDIFVINLSHIPKSVFAVSVAAVFAVMILNKQKYCAQRV